MAAPTVASVSSTSGAGAAGTSMSSAITANMPASIATGDLLIAVAGHDTVATNFTQGGATWTSLRNSTGTGNLSRLGIWARIATGTDSLTLQASANDYVIHVIRITGHNVTNIATDIVVPAVASAATGSANPPASGTVASADWLSIAAAVVDLTANGNSLSAAPSTYTSHAAFKSATSTSSVAIGVASKQLTAATSEDPGTFTNTSNAWVAQTLLIPPAPSGTPESRTFDGADDYLMTSAGTLAGETFGSRLALIYCHTLPTVASIMTTSDVGDALLAQFYLDGSGHMNLWNSTTSSNSVAATATIVVNKWFLVAMTKATGTATPRFHMKNITDNATGSWTHENGNAAMGDWGSGVFNIFLGSNHGGGELFDGEMAMVAAWDGVALSDAQLDELYTYADVAALSPNVQWDLSVPVATGITDATGGGADQVVIIGTAASTNNPPYMWGYPIPTSGLKLLMEADTLPTGTTIMAWTSNIGSLFAIQAIGANQPTCTVSQFPTGQAGVVFDGSNDFMTISLTSMADLILSAEFDSYAVFIAKSFGTSNGDSNPYVNDTVWTDGAGGGNVGVHLRSVGPLGQGPEVVGYNYDGAVDVTERPIVANTPYIVRFRHESGSIYTSVNGGTEDTVASGNTPVTATTLLLGQNYSGVAWSDMVLGALVIYNRALTSGEATTVYDYLNTKYLGSTGVSVNLVPITVTTSQQPLTITTGAVAVNLAVQTVTTTPVALTISAVGGPQSVDLVPVTVTASQQPLTITVGATARALVPTVTTVTTQPLTITTGAVTVALVTQTVTVTSVPVAPIPPWITFPDGVSTATDAIVTGLTNDVLYEFRVRAVSQYGDGPYSNIVESTPVTGAAAVSLVPITITTSQQPLTITAGGTTRALVPTVVTTSPVALTISTGAVTVNLNVQPVTVSTQALVVVPGATTRALVPTVATTSPVALTTTVGGTTRALALVTTTVTTQPLTVVPGAVTVALVPQVITVTPTPLIPPSSAIVVSPITVTVTASTMSVAGGPVAVNLVSQTVTTTPVALTISTGPTTRALVPVVTTTSTQPLTISTITTRNLALVTATVTTQPLTTTVGGVAVALNTQPLTVTQQPLTTSVGGVTVNLVTQTVTVSSQALVLAPGPTTRVLNTQLVTVTPQPLLTPRRVDLVPVTVTVSSVAIFVVGGAGLVELPQATATVTAVPLAVVPGGITTALLRNLLDLQAPALSPVPGVVTVSLSPQTLTVTTRSLVVQGGGSSIDVALTTATVTAPALTISTVTTINLVTQTVTLSTLPLTVAPGATAVSLVSGLISATTASLSVGAVSSVDLVPQTLTALPGVLTVSVGPVTVPLVPKVITLSPVNLLIGAVTAVDLVPRTITVTGSPLSVTPGPGAAVVPLVPAVATLVPVATTIATGPVQVVLVAQGLSVVAQPLSVTPGGVSISLVAQTITLSATTLTVTNLGGVVQLVAQTVTVTPRPLVTAGGAAAVQLVPIVIATTAWALEPDAARIVELVEIEIYVSTPALQPARTINEVGFWNGTSWDIYHVPFWYWDAIDGWVQFIEHPHIAMAPGDDDWEPVPG